MQKEKISNSLVLAERSLAGARHMVKVIMPISLDQKILLKALEKLNESTINAISFVLKYEHLKKKIRLSKKKEENEELFFTKCAPKYRLTTQEITALKEILYYGKRHKGAAVEFSRRNRIIIMDDDLNTLELTEEKVNAYILANEKLLESISKTCLN